MKNKIISKNGYSLAELLIAILILLLVSGVVAAGVPTAIRVYERVTEAANAQAYLTTTTTSLRDILDLSEETSVKSDNKTVVCIGNDKMEYTISLDKGGKQGITYVITNPYNSKTSGDMNLVSEKTGTEKEFYAKYSSVSVSAGIIAFNDLEIYNKDDKIVAGPITYKIKLLNEN